MVVVEEGSNFPSVLGRKTYPRTEIRRGPIADKAMALIGGETPVHLAQLLKRRPLMERIRPREPLSVIGDERAHVSHEAQLTKYPIFPILIRSHPLLDTIKDRATIIPRVKLLGSFGIVDPNKWPPTLAVEKNVPGPYPRPMTWPPGREIARLPAVLGIIPGPEKTVLPKISVEASLGGR